jgi:hypothetical protein
MANKFNGYELSNGWFEFLKNNVSIVKTNHSALYNYIIHKANKLGWPDEFGLPSENSMHASGFNNYKSYKRTLDDLVEFGVIRLIQESKNQHTSTVIALVNLSKAHTKALPKQSLSNDQSTAKATTKAEPTYINSKNDINYLNNETIKPLETLNVNSNLDTVEDILNWCNDNERELTNSPSGIINYHSNYLSLSLDEKINVLINYSKQLQIN